MAPLRAFSSTLTGILIDTEAGVLSLPPDKLHRLQGEIASWAAHKRCRKRQLLSLIGQLSDACQVVRPGRTFLRRMIDLSSVAKELHHHIRLSRAFRSDLSWWALFLEHWNGVSLFTSVVRGSSCTTLTTDASGTWGCGAFTSAGGWLQLRWPSVWEEVHITVKELLPIVVASATWGHGWRGRTVRCRCDNAAVVAILRSGTSKHSLAMHLMRCLFFFTAAYQIYLALKHVPGKLNAAADSISRGNLSLFFQLVPTAHRHPAQLSPALIRALILQTPDWSKLESRAAFYFAQGLAESTLRTYQSGQKRYLKFCQDSDSSPLPLSESVLCHFVSHLADSNLKLRTIKTYESSIRFLQIKSGLAEDGRMPRLEYVMRGIKKSEAKHGVGGWERLPITPFILRQLKAVWAHSGADPDTKLIWATCCLCFFASCGWEK